MNILITNISTFSIKKQKRIYELRFGGKLQDTIEAIQTNESVARAFAAVETIVNSGGMQRIIALCSQKVMEAKDEEIAQTALEYYSNVANSLWPDVKVDVLSIDNYPIPSIIDKIFQRVSTGDRVYIDSAGGSRDVSNILQFLPKLLNYIGIEHPLTLYSNVNSAIPFVADTSSFDKMTYLADAFNEFLTTGKADLLRMYAITDSTPQVMRYLIEMMCLFSDNIRILNLQQIDFIVGKFKEAVNDCLQLTDETLEVVMIKQFIPLIKNKLLGDDEQVDYLRILQWCLDNSLIQQAFTIYESKIPSYLFERGYICFASDNVKQDLLIKSRSNPLSSDIYSYALYTDVLSIGSSMDMKEQRFQILVAFLQSKYKSKDPQLIDIKYDLEGFNNYRLQYLKPKPKNEGFVRKLIECIRANRFASYEKLLNYLINSRNILYGVLGYEKENKNNVERNEQQRNRNFHAIKWIERNGLPVDMYKLHIERSEFVSILYGYVYVKAYRNKLNHVGDTEPFNEQGKNILNQKGYKFEDESLQTISRNMQLAINALKCNLNDSQVKTI